MCSFTCAAPAARCHRRGRGGAFPELLLMMGGAWGEGFGPGHGPGPRGSGRGRGRRARRGDIRSAALLLLAEGPRNGYGLMQEIEERSGGVWRPSAGSVYPALAQLEDEGLIDETEVDGRRAYRLTDAGRAHVEERRGTLRAPWESVARGVPDELADLRQATRSLGAAAWQVAQSGEPDQLAEAKRVLEEAKRSLYRLLAGEDPGTEES